MALPLPDPSARRKAHQPDGHRDGRNGPGAAPRPEHQPLAADAGLRAVVRYRGFVLMPQADLTWLVQPERSPVRLLPFRTPASSLADVKALVDWRLDQRAS